MLNVDLCHSSAWPHNYYELYFSIVSCSRAKGHGIFPRWAAWLKHKMLFVTTSSHWIQNTFWIFNDLWNSPNSACRFLYPPAHVCMIDSIDLRVIVNGCWSLRNLFFFLTDTFLKSEYFHLPKGLYIISLEYISIPKQLNRIWNAWLNCCPRNWPVTKCKKSRFYGQWFLNSCPAYWTRIIFSSFPFQTHPNPFFPSDSQKEWVKMDVSVWVTLLAFSHSFNLKLSLFPVICEQGQVMYGQLF